jgi:hypothetical protein
MIAELQQSVHQTFSDPHLYPHIHAEPIFAMHSSFALLAGLALPVFAETCDPKAYDDTNPYGLEETNHPAVMSKLNEYLVDNICIKYSDGAEQNVKEQCKDVCIPDQSASEGQAVVSSQSCIFGDNPWYDTSNMTPLLCGADKSFNGMLTICQTYISES